VGTAPAQGTILLYLRQPVALANIGLALLYCTVLSLGILMTSYLHWSGLTEAEVGAVAKLWQGGGGSVH